MNLCQTKSCFVCNRDVDGSGVLLSLETTSYSKTAFPTKLMQLLGDSFMVVILEDDKMCSRCANLINQTDKLEQDLRHIKSIIMGFLNEKYDLNREDEKLSSPLEEFQDPKEKNVFENQNLMQSPTIIVRHVDGETYQPNNSSKDIEESSGSNSPSSTNNVKNINDKGYQTVNNLKDIEEFFDTNAISKNILDVRVKCEPVVNADQNLNYNSSHNISEMGKYTISEAILKKLPEHDLMEKHSTLESYRNESNQTLQESQSVLLKEVKKENLSIDCSVNSTPILVPSTNNHFNIIETSEKWVTAPESKLSYEGEVKTKMKLFCEDPSSFKDITVTLSAETVPVIELPKGITEQTSKIELPNMLGKNKLRGERKRQTCSLKVAKQSNTKLKQEKVDSTVKKLRPILPKVSNMEEVLTSLSLIQNSNFGVNNEILVDQSKCYEFTNPMRYDTNNTNKIKPLNIEREKNSDQSTTTLEKAGNINSTTKTSLTVNLNTRCKVCNVCFRDNKTCECHGKKHLKDEKLFKCSFCTKSFKRKKNLKTHETIHTGKYLHCCEYCGRGFSKIDQLEEHRGKHTKEDRYICDVCGKKFHFHATYWIHRKWHDNPFPYKCNECGKPFKHSSQLSVHRRKHTGERPYKCSYCPLTFNVSNTLKRHLVLHTKEYPYKCEVCDQGFTTRFKYSEHLARKHDMFVEKPSTDPKDYKMVVWDNMGKETQAESLTTEKEIHFSESNCNVETLENPELIFHNDSNDCRIEVILPSPSLISDNNMSNMNWLT